MQKRRFNKMTSLVVICMMISIVNTCGCGGHHHDEYQGEQDDHDYQQYEDDQHNNQDDHYGHDQHTRKNNQDYQNENQQDDSHQDREDNQYVEQETAQHQQVHSHIQQPQLQMIQDKPRLLQTLKLTPITVIYYGTRSTPQYQQFSQVIPAYNDQFFSKVSTQIQFAYISSDKFKLARPNPSLSIYRNINNGEWLMYRGIFDKKHMLNWIMGNVVDPLTELTGEQLDQFFVQGRKGFILLDFGQFYLLKPKIMISQFCQKFELTCGKISHTNKALNIIIQLMRAQNQPGIPKLSYWNPKTQQLEIYTKDLGHITETQLMQLYSGHESVIPYESELDVAKVIHPETDIIEVKQNHPETEL